MKYALKKVKDIIFADTVTDEHVCTLNDLTDIKLSNGADTVDATGSDGSILAQWDTKKTSEITASNGAIETGMLALQLGTEEQVVLNGTGVRYREKFTLKSGNTTVTLTHKPSGTEGSEIKFIYKADSNGNPDTSYAQAAEASATAFAYTPATKVITLPTDVFTGGETVIVDYYPTYSEYKQITDKSNEFGGTYKVIVRGWFTDLCSHKDIPLQLVCPSGKVSAKFDLEFGDKAAVQDITINNLSSACANDDKVFWDMFTYDDTKIVDA